MRPGGQDGTQSFWPVSRVIGIWPLAAGYYIGQNRGGSAKMLSRLPGVSEDGGILTGTVVAIGGYVLLLTLAGAVLDAGTDTTADGPSVESTDNGVGDQPIESTGTNTEADTTESSGSDSSSDSTDDAARDTGGGDADGGTDNSSSDAPGDAQASGTADNDNTVTVEVVDVVDGDTMDIEYENGTEDTVRLIGVDTPEVHVEVAPDEYEGIPDTKSARQCLDEYGDEASTFAEQEIGGETVQLQFDTQSDRRGSFDRLLVYILHDGQKFNHLLIDEGLARVYDSTFTESDRFYETEAAETRGPDGCLGLSERWR
jgi:Micrococcal nuclease (thermonuclease) homologs